MGQFNIPKLSRNKYNFVKGADTDNFITQPQMMAASGGGGNNINSNTISQNAQLSSAIKTTVQDMVDDGELISASEAEQMFADKGVGSEDTIVTVSYANSYFATATYLSSYYISKNELTQAGYVTANELSNAGYVTETQLTQASYITNSTLSQASYVTQQGLSQMSYTTTTMVDEKLQDYSKTSVEKEEDVTRTVTQNDGIIVLASTGSRATTVTLPTTGIEDGKVIYIINKTGQAFTINTNGNIIGKDSSSTSRATQTISDNVIQVIYYDGEWFVI